MKYILAFWFIFLFQAVFAQSTHRRYLSGTGLNHTVMWDFYCSMGIIAVGGVKSKYPHNGNYKALVLIPTDGGTKKKG